MEQMSASQQKKRRQNEAAAQQSQEAAAPKSGRGAWIAGGIGAAVLVLLAIFFAVLNSGVIQRNATAATVGGHKVTPVMYNYFYQDALLSSYSSPDTPYDELTNQLIAETYAVCDAAEEAGFSLTEEQIASIDQQIANLELSAASQGVSVSAYLSEVYGPGNTAETFREYVELTTLASAYMAEYANSLSYTSEELSEYYEAHRDALDTVTYRTYTCSVTTEETDPETSSTIDSAASQAMAEEMAEGSRGDEAAFAQYARDNAGEDSTAYDDDDATLRSNVTIENLPENAREWLSDPARQYGDTAAFANDSGSWVAVMFIDNWTKLDNANTVSVRHILISASSSSDQETLDAAEAEAQDLLDQYLAGEQTEDAFAALAQEHSDDGSASDGGLIETYPGQTVQPFEDWCYDASRQPGDTGIVQTDYGFHVMYYIGQGGSARDYVTTLAKQSEDADTWATQLGEAMPVETHSFGMLFTALG